MLGCKRRLGTKKDSYYIIIGCNDYTARPVQKQLLNIYLATPMLKLTRKIATILEEISVFIRKPPPPPQHLYTTQILFLTRKRTVSST